jgi:hypothetical protein
MNKMNINKDINQAINNSILNSFLENVNRVEVIDQNGRSYVNWRGGNKVEIQLQDEGKTLKVFISNETEKV